SGVTCWHNPGETLIRSIALHPGTTQFSIVRIQSTTFGYKMKEEFMDSDDNDGGSYEEKYIDVERISEDFSPRRKNKTLIPDASQYFEPFKHGWLRKLTYKVDPSKKSKSTSYVCYVSPSGKKFWKVKALKDYLTNSRSHLTSDKFTFACQPLGYPDSAKEVIDYSCRSVVDPESEASMIGTRCRPQRKRHSPTLFDENKRQTAERHNPFSRESRSRQKVSLSTEKQNPFSTEYRSSQKVLKSTERPTKEQNPFSKQCERLQKTPKRKPGPLLRSPPAKKIKVETPDVVSRSEQLTTPSSGRKTENRKIDKFPRQLNSMQALIDYHKSLQSIFDKLEVADLLRVRLVCSTWRDIVDKPSFWNKICTKGLKITDWAAFGLFLENHKTNYLDMRGSLDVEMVDWEEASTAMSKTNVKHLQLSGCSAASSEKLSRKCKKLLSLNVHLVNADTVNLNGLEYIDQQSVTELIQVSYESTQGITLQGDAAPLLGLSNLTQLTLRTMKNLTTLRLDGGLNHLSTSIEDCRFLRLEVLDTRALISFNILNGISTLSRLEHLELIDFEVNEHFDEQLRKCQHLQNLLLIPANCVATSNKIVLEGILGIKDRLKSVIWGLHIEQLRKSKTILAKQIEIENNQDTEFVPILAPIPFQHLMDHNAIKEIREY
ncbi:hypothetical protein QAD02_014246, partial [Eretmocerus hayati]